MTSDECAVWLLGYSCSVDHDEWFSVRLCAPVRPERACAVCAPQRDAPFPSGASSFMQLLKWMRITQVITGDCTGT